jgi:hypothetical protein
MCSQCTFLSWGQAVLRSWRGSHQTSVPDYESEPDLKGSRKSHGNKRTCLASLAGMLHTKHYTSGALSYPTSLGEEQEPNSNRTFELNALGLRCSTRVRSCMTAGACSGMFMQSWHPQPLQYTPTGCKSSSIKHTARRYMKVTILAPGLGN